MLEEFVLARAFSRKKVSMEFKVSFTDLLRIRRKKTSISINKTCQEVRYAH